jgi:hypothetical protein
MTLLNSINRFRAMRVRQTSRYWQASAEIPSALYPFWKRTAPFEFKDIPLDVFFFARATEGLLTFFDCVRASGKPCALPSAAADSVWHAWIALDPASLDAFCGKHFGKAIPHVEAADMDAPLSRALANCLVAARTLEGKNPASPSVPRLFALDRKLRMPGGFCYQLAQGELACGRLDRKGRLEGEVSCPEGLGCAQLLAAGLVTQSYAQSVRMPKSNGAGCGGGCGGGD